MPGETVRMSCECPDKSCQGTCEVPWGDATYYRSKGYLFIVDGCAYEPDAVAVDALIGEDGYRWVLLRQPA